MAAAIPTFDFVQLLKDIPAGAWVAISPKDTAVLAYSADMQKAIDDAKAKGEEHPIIVRVPENQASLLL